MAVYMSSTAVGMCRDVNTTLKSARLDLRIPRGRQESPRELEKSAANNVGPVIPRSREYIVKRPK